MTLKEFLLTANADNLVALEEAKNHTLTTGYLIPATTVNQLFAQLDLTGAIKDAAEDAAHPARHKLLSVLLSIQGNHDFNFIVGKTAGDGNIAILDWLIGVAMTDKAAELATFKSIVTSLANPQVKPFGEVTLYDVLVARNSCPVVPVNVVNGYVTITPNATCVKHSPRLLVDHPVLGLQQINSFKDVEQVKPYHARVSTEYQSLNLYVDNPYEVL